MPEEYKPQPNKPEEKEKLNINILLADDSAPVLQVTAMMLKAMGCTVETVTDGRQLMERLDSAKPGEFQLIITDREMPEMDGIEVLEAMHNDERFKQIPAILYSGALNEDIKEIVTSLGYAYLAKPAGTNQLREKIKEALSSKSGA